MADQQTERSILYSEEKVLGKVIYYGFTVLFNRIFVLLPLKENRVLFLSDVRGSMGGNFLFIYEKLPKDYEVKTSFKAGRSVKRSLKEFLRQCLYLATSKYIFLEDYAECTAFMHVRKNQQLIQLWHGSGAYKKFGHSRTGSVEPAKIHPGYKRYTKVFVSSEFIRPCYAQAFNIPEERVIAAGVPGTDAFFDEKYKEEKIKAFYERCPGAVGKKVIVFAPTYRGAKVADATYGFEKLDLDMLYESLHEEYVFIIKWHPALYGNISAGRVKAPEIEKYKGFAYDFSDVREVNDLLFGADMLITDYSSVIFDYALLNKPVIYFAYDLEEYEGTRGLYFPFSDYVYGDIARTTDELIEAVRNGHFDKEKHRIFTGKFTAANDGHTAQKVLRNILGQEL